MKAPENTSKPKALCPRGAHLARLVNVVDLGSQRFKPTEEASRKIYFGFETCDARHTFKDENGPEPFMLQNEFAFYMTSANPQKPTKLRQFLIQWFGRDFPTEQEAKDFDFSKLLNRVCMLTVAHKPKTDGTQKAIIADIYQPTDEDKKRAPKAHGKLVCYEVGNGEDGEFEKLHDFLKKKIRESDEFKNAGRGQSPADEPQDEPEDNIPMGEAPAGGPEDDDSEPPF